MFRFGLAVAALLMSVPFTASAAYSFLTFTMNDGRMQSIGVDGLTINIDGDSLTAANANDERMTLPLESVVSMQFTDTEAAVNAVDATAASDSFVIFALDGTEIGRFGSLDEAHAALQPGIYVVKQNDGDAVKIKIGK